MSKTVTIGEWADDLRANVDKQGKGKLRTVDDKFCCLGRLCNLIDSDGWKQDAGTWWWGGDINAFLLPPGEITQQIGELVDPVSQVSVQHLNDLLTSNDEHTHTFSDIADVIEARYPRDMVITWES